MEIVGRDTQKDIFAGVALEPVSHSVDVWVTDVAAGGSLLDAAKETDPSIDTSLARLLLAPHSRAELDSAADQLTESSDSNGLPYTLYSIAVKPDGSGMELGVTDPVAAKKSAARVTGKIRQNLANAAPVKVTFTKAGPGKLYNRTDDSSPWVGGDGVLGLSSGGGCTLGVPALRKSNNMPVLLTAGHCYSVGEYVATAGGQYTIGKVTARTPFCTANGQANCFDTELIDGPNISAAAEGLNPHPIVSVKYSAMNDYVCHDGYYSYMQGRGNQVCGIKVTNADYKRDAGSAGWHYWIRGIQGNSGGYGSTHGDSGGTVYTYDACGCNHLQARGSITGGPVDRGPEVWWTETQDVFNMWGLKLNPKPHRCPTLMSGKC